MNIGLFMAVVLAWFVFGVIYRERKYYRMAVERAELYNNFVKAMEGEFGEYKVEIAAKKHGVSRRIDPAIQRDSLSARLGW